MFNSSFQTFAPTPKVPAPVLDGWIPCLPARLRPTLIARGDTIFLAKFDVGATLSASNRRQLAGAIESLAARSLGVESIDYTQLFHSPKKGVAIAVFWLPVDGDKQSVKYVSNLRSTKALPRGFSGNISSDYQEHPIEQDDCPIEQPPKDNSLRQAVKRSRLDISHVFPGIVRIAVDPKEGTLKTSFENTKLHAILKHRELYVRVLRKHGFAVDDSEGAFKLGTWRYDAGESKKNLFHVLTLYIPKADVRRVLCTFKPVWRRVVRPKTDAEIDRELNELLSNREALIKRLGIKTTTKNT